MKLAISIAIIRSKPPEIPLKLWVKSVSQQWEHRTNRDEKYIRWLEVQRLQLLHKTASLRVTSSQESSSSTPSPMIVTPHHINLTDTALTFLRSTSHFLSLPNLDASTLAASTEDLVLHLKDMLQQPDVFLGPFGAALEKCCRAYRKIHLTETNSKHLISLAEVLLEFLTVMATNRMVAPGEEHDEEDVVSSPITGINISLAPRTEKKVVVQCVVKLGKNPVLHSEIQRILLTKVHEICEVLSGVVLAKKPGTVESMYYLIEGLYLMGPFRVENSELFQKCISSGFSKFPVASQFLFVCGLNEK